MEQNFSYHVEDPSLQLQLQPSQPQYLQQSLQPLPRPAIASPRQRSGLQSQCSFHHSLQPAHIPRIHLLNQINSAHCISCSYLLYIHEITETTPQNKEKLHLQLRTTTRFASPTQNLSWRCKISAYNFPVTSVSNPISFAVGETCETTWSGLQMQSKQEGQSMALWTRNQTKSVWRNRLRSVSGTHFVSTESHTISDACKKQQNRSSLLRGVEMITQSQVKKDRNMVDSLLPRVLEQQAWRFQYQMSLYNSSLKIHAQNLSSGL